MTKSSTSVEIAPNSDPIQFSGAVRNGQVVQDKSPSTRTADDPMSDRELEEDIMDVSRSDVDKAELSLYSPNPVNEVQHTSGFIDDDENYEPPNEISITQRQEPDPDALLLHQNLETAEADLPNAIQNQPSADQDAEPIERPTSGEPSPAADGNVTVGQQSQLSLSRSPSLTNASDPDDYEPPEPAPLGKESLRPAQMSSVDSERSFSPPDVDTNDFVAPASSGSTPAVRQQVSVGAITVGIKSHNVSSSFSSFPMLADTNQMRTLEPNREAGLFTPYESPLKQFKSFRYHPQYLKEVSNGFRSLTYSHTINSEIPLCRYELDGVCNDGSCQSQHLRSIGLSGALIEA